MSAVFIPKTVGYYDLFEILKEMERMGHKTEDEVWKDYICEWGIKNDTIFWLGFEYYSYTEKEEEYKDYFNKVNNLLNLPKENDGIMVKVSW